MLEDANALVALATLHIAIFAMVGINENIQAQANSDDTIRFKRYGFRLAFRMGLWLAMLSLFPYFLQQTMLQDDEVILVGGAAMFSILGGEGIKNLTLVRREGTKESSRLSLFMGFIGILVVCILLIVLSLLHYLTDRSYLEYIDTIYMFSLAWFTVFLAIHLIHYTHKDWTNTNKN